MKYSIILSVLLILGGTLYALGSVVDTEEATEVDPVKANLALRQVGDQLLKAICDDTSRVQTVVQVDANTFTLELEQKLRYDTLPRLMHLALADYQLPSEYHVSVKDCVNDSIVLGYNHFAYLNNVTPCLSRHKSEACQVIALTFDAVKADKKTNILLPITCILLGLLGLIRSRSTNYTSDNVDEGVEGFQAREAAYIQVSQTKLYLQQQQITIRDGDAIELTYREHKLLKYLFEQANMVLPREQILDNVWGDEGLMVGRSLDVFISRLRKKLKDDESIEIKSVHGVGYKIEGAR